MYLLRHRTFVKFSYFDDGLYARMFLGVTFYCQGHIKVIKSSRWRPSTELWTFLHHPVFSVWWPRSMASQGHLILTSKYPDVEPVTKTAGVVAFRLSVASHGHVHGCVTLCILSSSGVQTLYIALRHTAPRPGQPLHNTWTTVTNVNTRTTGRTHLTRLSIRAVDPYGTGGHTYPNIWTGGPGHYHECPPQYF